MKSDLAPWDFKPTEIITSEIRDNKEARQRWYHSPVTRHYFYTGTEAANRNQRVSKTDNPPKFIRAFAADFDMVMTDERIAEGIARMRLKPCCIERSLGRKTRLVWLLMQPIPVESYDFCAFILQKSMVWLKTDLLLGLDEKAFTDPSRLLCNGSSWKATSAPPIPADEIQAFFVECGAEFHFKSCSDSLVPLEEVELGLRDKFPGFTWPEAFVLGAQGPSFWLPASTSTRSAIVKREGMFTFSGSAEKPFYTWADILGAEFVRRFTVSSIAKATSDTHWDGKQYWRKINGRYEGLEPPEMMDYLEVTCGLSAKAERGAVASIKKARAHIHQHNRIAGAAPFVGRPAGKIIYQGDAVLNTYIHNIVKPTDESTPWGPLGKFPFISSYFDALLDPPEQLAHLLAWYKHFYMSMYHMAPTPGQNIFLMGPPGVGKTLGSRRIFGAAVGGALDASDFLTRATSFNSQMFYKAYWAQDDETMGESASTQAFFAAAIKKATANQEFMSHKKFGVPTMTEWMGRIVITTNLDHVSSRSLGGLDNSSMDKTSLFRCSGNKHFAFPAKRILEAMIEAELPYFLRWLIEWEVPEHIKRNVRYGFDSHHEKTLLDQAHQSGRSAPFKELLIEALGIFFSEHKEAKVWTGTTTALLRLLNSNPHNDFVMRSLKAEQVNRYLEMIQREGLIVCRVETGNLKTRFWVFDRFGDDPAAPPAEPETPEPNPFAK